MSESQAYTCTMRVRAVAQTNGRGEAGYTVTRPDGSVSWIQPDKFSEHYRSEGMLLGEALASIEVAGRAARAAWAGERWIVMVPATSVSSIVVKARVCGPWVGCSDKSGRVVPWTPTQDDMLTRDWRIV